MDSARQSDPPNSEKVRAAAAPLLEIRRGGHLEALHLGFVAVCDPDGSVLESHGEIEIACGLRSSAKPIQALASARLGTLEAFDVSDVELACACASHSGEKRHVQAVRTLLQRAGLEEDALLCGIHPPFSEAAGIDRESWGVLNNNCSGKHALMLATCAHRGWATETYQDPEHPLQRAVRENLALMAGLEEAELRHGVDGCGVPAWWVPMRAAAAAFARLADPSGLEDEIADCCRRIIGAMTSHPGMVAGEGRLDTHLMEAAGGRIWAKTGAEGFYAVGIAPAAGTPARGIAVKVLDGDKGHRARAFVVFDLLERWGILEGATLARLREEHADPVLRNHRGIEVGTLRVLMAE